MKLVHSSLSPCVPEVSMGFPFYVFTSLGYVYKKEGCWVFKRGYGITKPWKR